MLHHRRSRIIGEFESLGSREVDGPRIRIHGVGSQDLRDERLRLVIHRREDPEGSEPVGAYQRDPSVDEAAVPSLYGSENLDGREVAMDGAAIGRYRSGYSG